MKYRCHQCTVSYDISEHRLAAERLVCPVCGLLFSSGIQGNKKVSMVVKEKDALHHANNGHGTIS